MIDSVLKVPGLRGLIIETFGSGNAPGGEDGSLINVIKAAVARGIVIVNVSQCQSGSVSALYAPATILGNIGVVFGHDMTTEAALTKLSYLLALDGLDYADIVAQMQISIRGELTEIETLRFVRAYLIASLSSFSASESKLTTIQSPPTSDLPSLTARQTAFTALGYAITSGDLPTVVSLLTSDQYGLLEAKDYADNTALHLAAVGPSTAVLRELLNRGASVHVRNRGGNTPLFLAQGRGSTEFVRLLTAAGALLHVEETERT